jgi:hypothetical protein
MKARALILLAAAAGAGMVQDEGPVAYRELSSQYRLADADAKMLAGKYLEAAVLYRTALLESGDRDAVRVPFALALLGNGDATYAGIEIRRAAKFFEGFARLRVAPEELFPSREELAELARTAAESADAEALIAAAYARILLGDRRGAHEAINRYASQRNEPALVRALRSMADEEPARPAPKPARAPEIDALQKRVEQLPVSARSPAPVAPGTPARAKPIVIEPSMDMLPEVFER